MLFSDRCPKHGVFFCLIYEYLLDKGFHAFYKVVGFGPLVGACHRHDVVQIVEGPEDVRAVVLGFLVALAPPVANVVS